MTNDAPKRVWTCPDDAEWITGHWDRASDGLPMEAEYIRADHAQAELQAAVAAAYEDAAEIAEWKCNKRLQYALGQAVRDAILALIPADQEGDG